jgi:FkbM family methyltransferase
MSNVKHLAKRSLAALPLKAVIITRAARLPPALRTKLGMRLLRVIAESWPGLPVELQTNLGVDANLTVKLHSSKTGLIFGAPRFHLGERASLGLALQLFNYSDCFLDVGANVGLFIFYLRCKAPSQKPIHFFEPDPTLFSALISNIKANKFDHVTGYPWAMSAMSGQTTFFTNKTDDCSGSLVKNDWSKHTLEPIEVQGTSFSDFVYERRLRGICAKVDVEGAEEAFFEGAKLALDRMSYLIIEILGPAIHRGLPARIIRAGFQAYYINDFTLEHTKSGEFTYVPPFYNWLFCRDTPTELSSKLGAEFTIKW